MKKRTEKDRFGNECTDTYMNDGQIKRCTQTNRNKEFEFMDNTYSWNYLSSLSSIKDYADEYHQQIKLCRDKYSRLLLYFYDEYMNFNGGKDREDYLWVVVKDENDADKLAEEYRLNRLRTPYITADENSWMAVHQFVKQPQKQNIVYDIGAATSDCPYSMDSSHDYCTNVETIAEKLTDEGFRNNDDNHPFNKEALKALGKNEVSGKGEIQIIDSPGLIDRSSSFSFKKKARRKEK